MGSALLTTIWFVLSATLVLVVETKEYCGKLHEKDFYCEQGHCCGKYECCAYYRYYKMWWFWLVWGLITLLGCCCAYHRRIYMGNNWYHGPAWNYLYPYLTPTVTQPVPPEEIHDDFPKYKLPTYAEVEAMPNLGPPTDYEGAPPPYTTISSSLENPTPVPPYTLWHENVVFTVGSDDVSIHPPAQPQTREEATDPELLLSLQRTDT